MSEPSPSTQQRHVAQRVFAAELNAATHEFAASDDEQAPKYVLLPSGQRANRVLLVGTLTETEDVGSSSEYWQGRVVDPTGTAYVYAGQYQPDAASRLRELEPPAYIAVVGKPRTFTAGATDDAAEADAADGDGADAGEEAVYVSVTPEDIAVVDEATRDRRVVETAMRTIDRLEAFEATADEDAALVRQQYDESPETYQEMVVEALENLEAADEPSEAEDTGAEGGDGAEQASGSA